MLAFPFLNLLGLFDYVNLQKTQNCAISDSGTISEESAILGFPPFHCAIPWSGQKPRIPGTIILTGFDINVVLDSVEIAIEECKTRN